MLARQAIYTNDNEVYGFELLYRNNDENTADIHCDLAATSELLVNLCTCALEENLTGKGLLFIKFDQSFITSDAFFPSDASNIVFEILHSVKPTKEVLSTIRKLKAKGLKFALEDYAFEKEQEPFLPLISIIKINMLTFPLDNLPEKIRNIDAPNITLLAKNVENEHYFNKANDVGFHLFQGYYLERPIIMKGKKVSPSRQVALRLMATLCRDDVTVDEVSEILSCDPRLIYKILKIVNCPLYPFKREIENIKEAVVMLGLETIKQWTIILLLSAESEQPQELFRTLLTRAKTCELYAAEIPRALKSDFFTLGLFSGIDAILKIELKTIFTELKLTLPTRTFFLNQISDKKSLLNAVKGLERNQQTNFTLFSPSMLTNVRKYYFDSIKWADELMELLI